MVSMLFRTNIMALVGGGRTPRFAPNKVILFDERLGRTRAELEFRSQVKRVLLAKERYSHLSFSEPAALLPSSP